MKADGAQAYDWLRKGADRGDGAAYDELGSLFYKGIDGKPDYKASMTWYAKAAALGDPVGQAGVGHLYEHGAGVPKDDAQAGVVSQGGE